MPLSLPPQEAARYLVAGQAPAPLVDLVHTMAFHAAAAGLRLGVFDALAGGARGPQDLAEELGAEPYSLRVLLDALAATGYLERDGDRYANGVAATWLVSSTPGSYGTALGFWHALISELWSGLDGSVRTGTPGADFYAWLATRSEVFRGFHALQRKLADWLFEEVAEAVPLPEGATRLLDLGGGHARFSIGYCLLHDGLSATVVDLPEALETGRANAAAAGLAGRVGFATEPGTGHDVVLLFNVLHGFAPEPARRLVEEAVAALRPGGLALVLETAPSPVDAGVVDTAFARCFELNLLHTQGGRLYPAHVLDEWLRLAGCGPATVHPLRRMATRVLLAAVKRGPSL
ncbi:methyltransferase [Nonomuraea sp. NPDC050663]|uniref:methyltransferase family protein n=1 Tax=Nonomuraea sp. NPDC050663 TaxID=3364370 RepID=UPI0037B6E4FF